MEKSFTVTTSWDDGHEKDLAVAELLQKYNLPGTFYVSPQTRLIAARDLLDENQIRQLSEQFEIGAHTLTHPDLTEIPKAEVLSEITSGRDILEGITHKKITAFCYPYGKFNDETRDVLKDLGFTYARTVVQFRCDVGDPLLANTTVHCYSHRYDINIMGILRAARFNPWSIWRCLDWSRLAMAQFDLCRRHGGVFHMWGHSWEIDEQSDWEKLEEVFSYIANHEEAAYVPNSSLGKT